MPITAELVGANPVEERAVVGAVAEGTRKALSRFGAFVYRRMKSSIKYATAKRQKSRIGEAPVAHRRDKFTRLKVNKKTGAQTRQSVSPLRELIAFAVVDNDQSNDEFGSMYVIVGPMIFRTSKVGGGKVPKVLEEGGTSLIVHNGVRKIARFAPHPFAGPAFRAELPQAPKIFEGIVK